MGGRVSRRKFLARSAYGILALSFLDAFVVEPRWLSFEHIDIPIRGLDSAFHGYRIALLSDFHIPVASKELVREAVSLALGFRPDLIAVPGDFVHGRWSKGGNGHGSVPSFAGYFEELAAPDGVVGTLGNHDHWQNAHAVREQLRLHSKIRLIDNNRILVRRGSASLAIGGVGDLWEDRVAPDEAFAGVGPDVPRIMLSHNPDVAEQMKQNVRVDLQLSGHTHGGEVRIPFGPAPIIPSKYGNKFRAGLCVGKKNRVYVTRGVCTISHFRFFCRPEVTGIRLVPSA